MLAVSTEPMRGQSKPKRPMRVLDKNVPSSLEEITTDQAVIVSWRVRRRRPGLRDQERRAAGQRDRAGRDGRLGE